MNVSSSANVTGRYLAVLRRGSRRASLVCIGVPLQLVAANLASDLSAYALNLDGVGTERFEGHDVAHLVEAYAAELQGAVPDGPLVLVGYSYGGLLAFALACRLRRDTTRRVEVVLVEPSSRRLAPEARHETPAPESPHDRAKRHARALRQAGAGSWVPYVWPRLRCWVTSRWARFGVGRRIAWGWSVTPEQRMRYYAPGIRRNLLQYEPEVLPGDLHLVGHANHVRRYEASWRDRVTGDCLVHELGGADGHNGVVEPTQAAIWLDLASRLTDAGGPEAHGVGSDRSPRAAVSVTVGDV